MICEKVLPYSSNLNGIAKRFNWELEEMMKTLIIDSGFPKTVQVFALYYVLPFYN